MSWIKICGFCDVESARIAAQLGADAIGLNFVPRSKRRIAVEAASRIAAAVRGQVELVGIVEHVGLKQAEHLRDELHLDRIQFHWGRGIPDYAEWPPWAYVAVGIASAQDAKNAEKCPGDPVLVDAQSGGVSGGLGISFDWDLVRELALTRKLVLAGGLTPDTVAAAIQQVRPFGVDVASGVELSGKPGHKDPELMQSFIARARNTYSTLRQIDTSK